MKFSFSALFAFSLSLCMAVFQSDAHAQLSVSNFEITPTSVLFDLAGTLPATAPADAAQVFFFVNPDEPASPRFTLDDFLDSASNGFTGTQELRGFSNPIATGGSEFGDYFFVAFQTPLTAGEAVNGRVTANWDSPAFDPTVISALEVYWGAQDSLATVTTGVLVDTVAVSIPEPATATAIGSLLVGSIMIRRRRLS